MIHKLGIGDLINGQYRILRDIHGGMGIVFICENRYDNNKKIVLKTLKDEYLSNSTAIQLFLDEARIWVTLGYHDHIVWAKKADLINKRPFIILEYGGGWNLRSWIQQHSMSWPQCVDISIKIARGMDFAQKKIPAIVHRDLKPENVLIKAWLGVNLDVDTIIKNREQISHIVGENPDNPDLDALANHFDKEVEEKILNIKVTDFGIARAFESIDEFQPSDLKLLAVDQGIAGTPPYMSPEQCQGKVLDGRSDIYAFGIILYEMVTGKWPYDGHTRRDFLRCHVEEVPRPIRQIMPKLPENLSQIIMRCLEKKPTARYDNFSAVIDALSPLSKEVAEETQVKKLYSFEGMIQKPVDEIVAKGVSLIALGNVYEGLGYIERAIELAPNEVDILNEVGDSLWKAGRPDLSLEFCNKALAMDTNNFVSLNIKGIALAQLNQIEEAFSCFEQLLELDPNNAEILCNKGAILCDYLEQPTAALSCFERAVKIDPNLVNAWISKGIALRNLSRYEDAIASFNRALEIDPSSVTALLRLGGMLNDKLRRSAEALTIFERLIKMNPNIAEAWHDRGVTLEALGKSGDALKSYIKALEIDPKFAGSLYNKGVILARSGNFEKASICFEELLSIYPGDVQAMIALQACLQNLRR